jgi:hypothetical protein
MFSEKSICDEYDPLSKEWNTLLKKYEECSTKINKLEGIHGHMKKFSKYGFCNDPIPSTFLKLRQKYEVEIALLDIQKNDIDKKMKTIWDQMEGLFKITNQNSQLKKITKLQKRQLEREMCSICYDNHSITELVTTTCGHSFGKCCLSKWMEYNYENVLDTTCPYCRNTKFDLVRYIR